MTFQSLVHIPFTNMNEAGFMTDIAVSHQVAIETLWSHFWGAVMSSIFIYSRCCGYEEMEW